MRNREETVLSIIVPIYNGSAYVDALVKMAAGYLTVGKAVMAQAQDMRSVGELILIDDGSQDDTYEKCAEYAKIYNWIHLIHTENHGVSHARNTGLSCAKGKWIQFLDADDVIEQEMFEAFYSLDADILICGCKRIHGSKQPVLCGPKDDRILRETDIRQLFDKLAMEDRYWMLDYCWNKWYLKSIIEANTLRFPETMSLGEDFVFNAQYMKHVKSMGIRKTCYYQYRVGDTGLVSRFQKTPWHGRVQQYEAQKALYQSLELWDSNEIFIHRQYGQIAFGDLRMVNSPNCRLSEKEKTQFIKNVMDSPLYMWIQTYLDSKNGKVFQIYAKIWRKKQVGLTYALILTEKGKHALESMRHEYHEKKDQHIKKVRIPVIRDNKAKLKQETFTILSQNCVGGVFYHDMEMEFLSPTINLFFTAKDFLKFVWHLDYYLSLDLVMTLEKEYPIGILDDIKVHFYHYATATEAKASWERRKRRIVKEKILVLMTDRDGFDESAYQKWCEIKYPKVLFTANKKYAGHPDAIYYPEFQKEGCVNNYLIEKRMFYREDKLIERINRL